MRHAPIRGETSAAPLLDLVLAPGQLRHAWRLVRANHGVPGSDGVTIARFERDLAANLTALARDVRAGVYRPASPLPLQMRRGTKVRLLAIPTVRDRVLQRATLDVLTPRCDPRFAAGSFGYRPGLGVRQAVARIAALRRQGLLWVVDADIADCFASFDHARLRRVVREFVPDPAVCALLDAWIALPGWRRGVPLGSVVSPFFCNIYLHALDLALDRRGFPAVRYADDFIVLAPDPARAGQALGATQAILRDLRLELNPRKTGIVSFAAGFTFLGVTFRGADYGWPPAEDVDGDAWALAGWTGDGGPHGQSAHH